MQPGKIGRNTEGNSGWIEQDALLSHQDGAYPSESPFSLIRTGYLIDPSNIRDDT